MALNYPVREPSTRDSTPYLLTTGTTPPSITAPSATGIPGAPVSLTTRDLINSLRTPIEVTELHFVVTETNVLLANNVGWWMGGIEVNLALGIHQLTQGFCPVGALGVRREALALEGNLSGGAAPPIYSNTIRWILPQPLIVGPNEGFSGSMRLSPNLTPFPTGGTGNTVVTLSMVARGRRLPAGTPVPASRAVPFASGWIFSAASANAPDVSFQNVFPDRILHVTSLNAVPVSANIGVDLSGTFSINAPGGIANGVIRALAGALVHVGDIFSNRNALEEAHDLNPGEGYKILHGGTYSPVAGTNVGISAAMIGWREE